MDTQRIDFVDVLPLDSIMLDPNPIRRELNQEHIQDLIESFNLLPMGPLEPLIVKPLANGQYQIISGNHRYMALREGRWKEAPCHVIEPLNDAEEFLMKLHANSRRKNLDELEACEALAREKAIYETFYPDTKWGGNHRSSPCGQFVHTASESFARVKAKALGAASRTLRRDVKIGQLVQEMPELKEAKATKMDAYLIAQRKPEERELVRKALQEARHKPEALKAFIRQTKRDETDDDEVYRCFKNAHRLLQQGINWRALCRKRLGELVTGGTLREISRLLELAESQARQTYRDIQQESA